MTKYGREKYCSYCCSWWGVEHFAPHPRGQGQLDNRCHACQKERRTSRTVQPLALALLALLALMLGGCNGHSLNDREATWCVVPELYEPAKAAADEWHERSDGEVRFTLDTSPGCSAPLSIFFDDLPDERGGVWSMDRDAVVIEPGMSEESVRVGLLHEWGHYLTGREHSDYPGDVMYERYGGTPHLTEADVARLDWHSRRITAGYFP